jgi:hypothetical protein
MESLFSRPAHGLNDVTHPPSFLKARQPRQSQDQDSPIRLERLIRRSRAGPLRPRSYGSPASLCQRVISLEHLLLVSLYSRFARAIPPPHSVNISALNCRRLSCCSPPTMTFTLMEALHIPLSPGVSWIHDSITRLSKSSSISDVSQLGLPSVPQCLLVINLIDRPSSWLPHFASTTLNGAIPINREILRSVEVKPAAGFAALNRWIRTSAEVACHVPHLFRIDRIRTPDESILCYSEPNPRGRIRREFRNNIKDPVVTGLIYITCRDSVSRIILFCVSRSRAQESNSSRFLFQCASHSLPRLPKRVGLSFRRT